MEDGWGGRAARQRGEKEEQGLEFRQVSSLRGWMKRIGGEGGGARGSGRGERAWGALGAEEDWKSSVLCELEYGIREMITHGRCGGQLPDD